MAGKKIKVKGEDIDVSDDMYVLAHAIRDLAHAIRGIK